MKAAKPTHLLFAKEPSPRLTYIIETLLGKHWQITHDLHFFEKCKAIKINYSTLTVQCPCFNVIPHGLLHQTDIHKQRIYIDNWFKPPVFFCFASELGFDIFAASFYLLSRYEEYLPHETDSFGRFPANKSLAYRENFLQIPLIDLWLQEFEKKMQSLFPAYRLPQRSFVFIPGFDIDMAYKYHYRGIIKNMAEFLKAMITGNVEEITESARVLIGNQRDPFYVFDEITEILAAQNLPALFFFLVSQKKHALDKNIAPQKKGMRLLIQQLSKQFETGIHLSVQSSLAPNPAVAEQEIKNLTNLIKSPITKNRFHYLHFHLPESYEQLIKLGITADYSMGYSTANGFRASYAQPFQWYHLPKETTTHLTVYPFCWMDTAAIFQQKLTPQAAYTELQQLITITQSVNGFCMPVWHNHCISNEPNMSVWKQAFYNFFRTL